MRVSRLLGPEALADVQDTQTRIRQGLKENLRTSNEQYEDHLKGTLNKLKRSYWSKCQAVEVSGNDHSLRGVLADGLGLQEARACHCDAGQTIESAHITQSATSRYSRTSQRLVSTHFFGTSTAPSQSSYSTTILRNFSVQIRSSPSRVHIHQPGRIGSRQDERCLQ